MQPSKGRLFLNKFYQFYRIYIFQTYQYKTPWEENEEDSDQEVNKKSDTTFTNDLKTQNTERPTKESPKIARTPT